MAGLSNFLGLGLLRLSVTKGSRPIGVYAALQQNDAAAALPVEASGPS
jgi:hypothetical protein